MKQIFLTFLFFFIDFSSQQSLQEDIRDLKEGVFILTDDNFEYILQDYEYLFVLFTSPSCQICHILDDEFRKAAKQMTSKLQKPPVYFGILNTYNNPISSQKYRAMNLPKLTFIQRRKQIQDFPISQITSYQDIKSSDYVRWLAKKVYNGVQHVKDMRIFNQLAESQNALVVFKGDIQSMLFKRMYEIVARRFDYAYFIRIDDKQDINQIVEIDYEIKNQIRLITRDQNKTYSGEIDALQFERWLTLSILPAPIYFDERYFSLVFKQEIPSIFLIINPAFQDYSDYVDEFQNIVQMIKSDKTRHDELIFAESWISSINQKRVADMIGINYDDCPILVYFKPENNNEQIYHYILADLEDMHFKLNFEFIREFLDNIKSKQLISKVQNQQHSIELKGSLYHIYGSYTLQRLIRRSLDKDLIILFYNSTNKNSEQSFDQKAILAFTQISATLWNQQDALQFLALDLQENDIQFQFQINELPAAYYIPSFYSLDLMGGEQENYLRYDSIQEIQVNLTSQREILEFLYTKSANVKQFIKMNGDSIDNFISDL